MEKFKLKDLPFEYDALEPVIDKSTVHIHHDKHQQTYTDNLNKALEDIKVNCSCNNDKVLEEILKSLDNIPEDKKVAVINNGGGVFNHEFYWDGLTKACTSKPNGNILESIEKRFNSFDSFKEKFKDVALKHFGSGWGWLVLDSESVLQIISTPNQVCPVSSGYIPLLVVDVWEHAYYLKYQNKRAEYLDSYFNIINWDVVEERFNKAISL